MVAEDLQSKRVERRRDRAHLGEDVDAVALLLDHALDPPDLPLDPVQAIDERLLLADVAVGGVLDLTHVGAPCSSGLRVSVPATLPSSRRLEKRRSLRLFETTKRLEEAIAAAATIGFSRPAAASGIAATL